MDELNEMKKREQEEKNRFASMTKKEKEKYQNVYRGRIDKDGVKKKRQTLLDQEIELHEAYQLILKEHHKKVKRRVQKKLAAISTMKKMASAAVN